MKSRFNLNLINKFSFNITSRTNFFFFLIIISFSFITRIKSQNIIIIIINPLRIKNLILPKLLYFPTQGLLLKLIHSYLFKLLLLIEVLGLSLFNILFPVLKSTNLPLIFIVFKIRVFEKGFI